MIREITDFINLIFFCFFASILSQFIFPFLLELKKKRIIHRAFSSYKTCCFQLYLRYSSQTRNNPNSSLKTVASNMLIKVLIFYSFIINRIARCLFLNFEWDALYHSQMHEAKFYNLQPWDFDYVTLPTHYYSVFLPGLIIIYYIKNQIEPGHYLGQ